MRRSIVWTYSKEELQKMVDSAPSMKDFMQHIGMSSAMSSYQTVKRCLEYYGIDWKPLALKGVFKKRIRYPGREVPAEELFTWNCQHGRNVLRARLLRDNLIPYKCAICGIEPFWNGKPMTLILDHINGVRNDNRLENLRFVCGNCNSQLETTAGNNNAERRKELRAQIKDAIESRGGSDLSRVCPICEGPMTKGAEMCDKCRREKVSKECKRPPKDELVQDILVFPMTKIGKKYGVSDNAVRKWLKYYELPTHRKDIMQFRKDFKDGKS